MDASDRKVQSDPLNRDPVVLCVDDEPGVLHALRRSLRNEPCNVITAGSPDEALGWLEEVPVALVITDQRMPGMSGTELLDEIRKRFPGTARALLTGYRTPSAVREGLEAGADTFFFKPWDERYLVDSVRRILGLGNAP
ncbi:MAG TPA: response regulator [Planctomycetota bacterium]|nr:response regulator [Planctomycetota bacterium]